MSGFLYNGKHSSEFSCWYVPSPTERMNSMTDFEVIDGDVTGHDGGYYYGNRVKAREFTLECYFEEISVETKNLMFQW